MSSPVSSLLVGDRLVSRCDDGLLEAEYALFDRSEILISPGAAGEGYMTTAGFARARLYAGGVTADLAHDAFAAMRGRHMRPLARSSAVRNVIEQLGPYETFQGGRFMAGRGRYSGVWLDLDALAAACPMRDASILFQAVHLLLVLEEAPEGAPVRLMTQTGGEAAAAGRTWRRVDLQQAARLPWVLREMQPPARAHGAAYDEADVREEILRDLQARAATAATSQPRLGALAAAIARTGVSSRPAPPAPGDALRTPTPRASPRPPPPADAIDFNTALQQRTLRTMAESLSVLVERPPFAPDRAILAARAWVAAGEPGFARHFARRVVDDASAGDASRLEALEILESTPKVREAAPPPPAHESEPAFAAAQEAPSTQAQLSRTALAPSRAPSAPLTMDAPVAEARRLDPHLVLLSEPNSERSAGFRMLRDNLLAKNAPRIIAVTSGAAHEGKTTCAINLALALSERPGARVLLMEANFFAPSLGEIFHIDATVHPEQQTNLPWLSPYRIAQMMRGLHVAALVRAQGDPAPVFDSRWFDSVIGHLSGAEYDYVVIDAAALDGSPAVAQVLRVADGTLLTVRSQATTARSLRRAAEQIPEGRALGVALMDAG